MLQNLTTQTDWVSVILAALGFVVWLARLEGKVRYNEKSIDILTARHDSLDSELVEKLGRLETAVARIEGYLKAKNEETGHE